MDVSWLVRCCGVFLLLLSAEAHVVSVDVHATKGLIGSGHRYLDVRTVEEFNKGHVEGAVNIPYMFFTPEGRVKNPQFVEQVSAVCNKADHLVVGCQSGVRSLGACSDLLKSDFKNVKNVEGGYAAWVENGFAVKKPEMLSMENAQETCGAIVTVNVHAAKALVESGHRYLDVRTQVEFGKSHIDNAVNIPFMFITPEGKVTNPEFLEQVSTIFNKDDNLVVGCNSGGRSLKASLDLLKAGFKNVKNMEGGYAAWVASGLAEKNPEEKVECLWRK